MPLITISMSKFRHHLIQAFRHTIDALLPEGSNTDM
jgi:hypothetical protein